MPIPYKVVYFEDDPDKEIAFRSQVKFYLQKLQGMPTHAGLFDVELFEQLVIEMVLCEMETAIWDRAIHEDPFNRIRYIGARAKVATRLDGLRGRLGIDMKSLKQLKNRKGAKEDDSPVEPILPQFEELEV